MSIDKINNFNKEKIVLKETEQKGKKIYNQNKFYQKIVNLMEHPEFREFFDKYLNDWEDIKLIIAFMKTYEMIEKNILDEHKEKINGYHKLYILDQLFKNKNSRKKIINEILQIDNNLLK